MLVLMYDMHRRGYFDGYASAVGLPPHIELGRSPDRDVGSPAVDEPGPSDLSNGDGEPADDGRPDVAADRRPDGGRPDVGASRREGPAAHMESTA